MDILPIKLKGENEMIDLKIIIDKYPRNVETRSQLRNLLHDLYPTEKRAVNIALTIYDSGIVSKLAVLSSIDNVMLYRFIKQLKYEFGIQEQFAVEGIEAWAEAYGVFLPKTNIVEQKIEQKTVVEQRIEQQTDIAHNSNESQEPDYEIKQCEQGVVILKARKCDEADVVIPDTINGKKVIGIGEKAYFDCKTMKTLYLSDGIEFIEDGAFANCKNLQKIIFPKTLIRIGSENSDTKWNSNNKGAFENSGVTKLSFPERLEKIGRYSFSRCNKLTSIEFPLSLKKIGVAAFSFCSALKRVVLNEGLEIIEESVFNCCLNLSMLQIPSTVYKIAGPIRSTVEIHCYPHTYAFRYARMQGYKVWPINEYPLDEWEQKIKETIKDNSDKPVNSMIITNLSSDYELEQVPQGLVITKFKNRNEVDVVIPNTIGGKKVVGIGENAYSNYKTMKTLLISDGIEFIENGAFANCENLSKCNFSQSLQEIGSSAFMNCSKLTEIVLNEGLKIIGKSAFCNCTHLSKILIPSTVSEMYSSHQYDYTKTDYDMFAIATHKIRGVDVAYKRNDNLVVYCYPHSCALEYARRRGYRAWHAKKFEAGSR